MLCILYLCRIYTVIPIDSAFIHILYIVYVIPHTHMHTLTGEVMCW